MKRPKSANPVSGEIRKSEDTYSATSVLLPDASAQFRLSVPVSLTRFFPTSVCLPCFSRTTLCSGISLPYSPASPSRSFPAFYPPSLKLRRTCRYYEDAKTSRTPPRRSRCSRPAVPASDCLLRSQVSTASIPVPGRCSTGVILFPVIRFGSLVLALPCFRRTLCRYATFSDPGRTFTPSHFGVSVLSLRPLIRNDFHNTVISGFNSAAFRLAVYASCRHH